MMRFWCAIFVGILLKVAKSCEVDGLPLKVNLTLIQGAATKGAVCLDGTVPGYHLDPGHGSGANSWLVNLDGGGWCNTISSCDKRKKSHRGSSNLFEKQISFIGILSPQEHQNPDFFNWNRIMIRYCDGASFSGDAENKTAGLQFRGQRIWQAAMEELMSKGMRNASQALLSGCSAGGLATILHCDEFRDLFPQSTIVKCLSDAGLFMDVVNIVGEKTLRYIFDGIVRLQGVEANLLTNCTNHLDPTACFIPQNIISNIKAPLFILNSAYDSWQVHESLAPATADPQGNWKSCRNNITECSRSQIQVLKGFRDQILNAVSTTSVQSGYFITSCFSHCQSMDAGWFTHRSRALHGKTIATSVEDWYFDRAEIKAIDKAYPSKTITC